MYLCLFVRIRFGGRDRWFLVKTIYFSFKNTSCVFGSNMIRPKQLPYPRAKQPTSPTTMANVAALYNLPNGTILLDHQVAGHTFEEGKDTIGMLKDQHDGSILKAAYKPLCGEREIRFYEEVTAAKDPSLVMLKQLVPDFRGTAIMQMGERRIEFIRLADITHAMTEPCIMDIKIGKRTWDPLAAKDKIEAEELKYQACKKSLGICIPGFQVYSVKNGSVKRYGKDYGKKLNETSITDAFKLFLNADHGLCRPLLVQILSGLWNIQKWARTQTNIQLFSSSILLAYDARYLRNNLELQKKSRSDSPTTPKTKENTDPALNSPFNWPINTTNGDQSPSTPPPLEMYKKVQRSHSAQNNYDEDLKSIRENYTFMLDNLISGYNNKEWAFVKMIDFAHVFPSEHAAPDANYLFGVESLVKIFEQFLSECQ